MDRILLSRIFFLRLLGYPVYYLFLLDYRLPFLCIPLVFCCFFVCDARCPTDKNDARLVALFDLHETQHKQVRISTDEALDSQVSKLALGVRRNLIMLRFDQMKDNMRCESVLPLNIQPLTFSLQNHFPQALLEHFSTQFLFLMAQKEHA